MPSKTKGTTIFIPTYLKDYIKSQQKEYEPYYRTIERLIKSKG